MKQNYGEAEALALVNRLITIITSSLDINEVYERFATELRQIIDIDWASICVIEKDKLRFYALSTQIGSAWELGELIPLEGTATQWVTKNKQALFEPDLLIDKKFWTGDYHLRQGLRSIVYLPLIEKDEGFGTLILGSRHPNAYGEKELALLDHISNQIALPVRNDQLYTELKRKTELLKAVSRLTRIISSTPDLTEVFHHFSQEVETIVSFARLAITIVEGDKLRYLLVSSKLPTELTTGATDPLKDSATAWVIEHKKTNIEPDFTRERQFAIDEVLLRNGFRSAIRVPLMSRGEVFGTLILTSAQPNAFGDREQEILEQLAAQIACPIMLSWLYDLKEKHYQVLENQGREREEFFTAVSHEIQTPLTAIIASIGLLAEELNEKPESPQARLTQNILHSSHNMKNRLTELPDLTKVQLPTFQLQTETLDIHNIVQVVVNQLLPIIKEKGQSLSLEIPASLPKVKADSQRLEQILLNLMSNAIKFTPKGGSLTIRAKEQETDLIIEVKDTGPGIPKEIQARLFRPYYRLPVDRHRLTGLGLGLSICKRLVELHSGNIWVESEPGRGSTFAFSLPLASEITK
jgi:signal transduction histidine kinase